MSNIEEPVENVGEPVRRRRRVSSRVLAIMSERSAMLPFRKRIGKLQSQVALTAALARSTKTIDPVEINAAYPAVRGEVERILFEIESAVAGRGVGPAEDCRKALRGLLSRLP